MALRHLSVLKPRLRENAFSVDNQKQRTIVVHISVHMQGGQVLAGVSPASTSPAPAAQRARSLSTRNVVAQADNSERWRTQGGRGAQLPGACAVAPRVMNATTKAQIGVLHASMMLRHIHGACIHLLRQRFCQTAGRGGGHTGHTRSESRVCCESGSKLASIGSREHTKQGPVGRGYVTHTHASRVQARAGPPWPYPNP